MNYDFESIPNRSNCGSVKWESASGASIEQVPLSTADMEFPMAPEIAEGMAEYARNSIYGYTKPTQPYYDAVCGWMSRKHNWETKSEWIVTTPGVVYALGLTIEALSAPGDSVIVITPVYYPFDLTVLAKGRNIEYTTLKLEGTKYTIDMEDLERKAAKPECSLLLFCNPHNPVGRVWTPEELKEVVDICDRNNVIIIDDEIHHDLVMPGYEHTVMATVSERAQQICVVCTAPSKTFNLAGLQGSNIFIADPVLRGKVRATETLDIINELNCFSYKATELAYTRCDAWLDELIDVIAGNAKYIRRFMAEYYPEITVFPLEGTYLLWLDMRAFGIPHKELEKLMKEDAHLYLDEGYIFGPAGRGFERINLACSRATLEKSMVRFRNAVEAKKAEWDKSGKPFHQTLAVGEKIADFSYENAYEKHDSFLASVKTPTILLFSRYYACPLCQAVMAEYKKAWPQLKEKNIDLRIVLQSPQTSVAPSAGQFPFELICDSKAELYDKFNVFEADDVAHFIDKKFVQASGGSLRDLAMALYTEQGGQQSEGREYQVPAVFLLDTDGMILYSHYGQSVSDLPEINDIVKVLEDKER